MVLDTAAAVVTLSAGNLMVHTALMVEPMDRARCLVQTVANCVTLGGTMKMENFAPHHFRVFHKVV